MAYSGLEKFLSWFDRKDLIVDTSVWLDNLKKELVTKKYSSKTIKAYLHYNEELLEFSGKNPIHISQQERRKEYSRKQPKRQKSRRMLAFTP